jgi:hypothetical protein
MHSFTRKLKQTIIPNIGESIAKGCHPMAIASAYELEESFRTFAALDIELTDGEIAWLNLTR